MTKRWDLKIFRLIQWWLQSSYTKSIYCFQKIKYLLGYNLIKLFTWCHEVLLAVHSGATLVIHFPLTEGMEQISAMFGQAFRWTQRWGFVVAEVQHGPNPTDSSSTNRLTYANSRDHGNGKKQEVVMMSLCVLSSPPRVDVIHLSFCFRQR